VVYGNGRFLGLLLESFVDGGSVCLNLNGNPLLVGPKTAGERDKLLSLDPEVVNVGGFDGGGIAKGSRCGRTRRDRH
jgi:hypothetical protein